MNVTKESIRDLCTDAVFERGQQYRSDGRIQQIRRFDSTVTATVQGSSPYDVTVQRDGNTIDARCTCPYDGDGECKHVIAVLLDVAANPPRDESERVETALQNISANDLQTFVRDALTTRPKLRDQFLARFGDTDKSIEEYRAEIGQLFDQHTQDYPVITDAIDLSYFFELAEQYRDRDHYLEAATIYRALFEGIDDNAVRIDAAYDHYAEALQSALDGYVECVLAADTDADAFGSYVAVLEERSASEQPINSEQFQRALDELENARL